VLAPGMVWGSDLELSFATLEPKFHNDVALWGGVACDAISGHRGFTVMLLRKFILGLGGAVAAG